MAFGLGLLFYILGSAVIAGCIVAIPGPGGAVDAGAGHDHGHGHGSH